MESRVGWNRAVQAARYHPTYVLACDAPRRDEIRRALRHLPRHQRPRIIVLRWPGWLDAFDRFPFFFFLACRVWHWFAFRVARRWHAKHQFQLVHQVNYCSYREPGYLWRLPIPFVWGPWGGTQNSPWWTLAGFDLAGGVSELVRAVLNRIQLRFDRRLRKIIGRQEAKILVVHREARDSLERVYGVRPPLQLETGTPPLSPPEIPDASRITESRPLRILWTGRLMPWKGLPLLLMGLADMPDIPWRLRVLGVGPRGVAHRRLATRLGLTDRIEWVGWPPYQDALSQYAWADVFAFTSLRDTSGAGLLEALAYGVPIVGLQHQGAREIMTCECAVPIHLGDARAIAAEFAVALRSLAANPERRRRLSEGAYARAQAFTWTQLGRQMAEVYAEALEPSKLKDPSHAHGLQTQST